MHRKSRGGSDEFFDFGDPFAGFGSFPGQGSLISGFFGGRDPFDDPFFRSPFGSMFDSSFSGGPGMPFASMHPSGFLDHQAPEPKRPRGPIIEEINSDDEKEAGNGSKNPKNSSKEPLVEDPDDEGECETCLDCCVCHSFFACFYAFQLQSVMPNCLFPFLLLQRMGKDSCSAWIITVDQITDISDLQLIASHFRAPL